MADRNEALKELARRELARRQAASEGIAVAAPAPVESGMILPISKDAQGNVSFDSNAGILGSIKRAIMLPGQAMKGEIDPNSPEAIARAFEFASVVSPINPAVRAGERAVPGVLNTLRKPDLEPPTQQALKEAAGIDYEALRGLGVDYKTSAVNTLAGEIQANLTNDGIITELAPKTFSVLARLSEAPEGSVASISGLEAARRAFGNAAKDFTNPTEQLAAKRAMESLDQFLARSDPATIQSGSADEVANLLGTARGNYAAAKRSETLTDLEDAAQLRANAANSGQNAGNTTRQRVASLLLNDKASAGFGAEDVAALRAVNEGSFGANATRRVGNMLGGGGGIGAGVLGLGGAALGALSGTPEFAAAGAALPLGGALARQISNILTERALSQVERGTRKRSPLYEEMLRGASSEPKIPERNAALIRALLSAQSESRSGE